MNAKLIMGVVLYMMIVGYFAAAMGYSAPAITSFTEVRLPGYLAMFDPVVWAVGSMASFFSLLVFQVQGVPTMLNAFAFLPVVFGVGWLIVSMVRGNQ